MGKKLSRKRLAIVFPSNDWPHSNETSVLFLPFFLFHWTVHCQINSFKTSFFSITFFLFQISILAMIYLDLFAPEYACAAVQVWF